MVKVFTAAEIARVTDKTSAGQMVGHGRIRKAASPAKMQGKDGTQARATGTAGEAVRAKAKTGTGVVSPKNGKARIDRMTEHTSTKGSSKDCTYSVDEAGDIDWWTQSDG